MKPILLTTIEVAGLLEDMKAGVLSGDTDEGSIEFSIPSMEDTLHASEWAMLGAEQAPKWERIEGEPGEPVMYRPKREFLFCKGVYRKMRLMGQGSVRLIGDA